MAGNKKLKTNKKVTKHGIVALRYVSTTVLLSFKPTKSHRLKRFKRWRTGWISRITWQTWRPAWIDVQRQRRRAQLVKYTHELRRGAAQHDDNKDRRAAPRMLLNGRLVTSWAPAGDVINRDATGSSSSSSNSPQSKWPLSVVCRFRQPQLKQTKPFQFTDSDRLQVPV